MLELPARTLYNRKIPKTKFYEKIGANTRLKELFVDQIEAIIWKHKLSQGTLNLEPTPAVQEIQVFEIHLRQRDISLDILKNIDKAIPYPILHVLCYQDEVKFAIAYKQRNQNNEDQFVVQGYCQSPWQTAATVSLRLLHGLTLEAVYEHIVRSLLSVESVAGEDLAAALERQAQIKRLKWECACLESCIRSEKQFAKRVELNLELQRKQIQLERL